MKLISKGILYWNTVRKLHPVQIKYQFADRIKKQSKLQKYSLEKKADKIHIVIPELDTDKEYLSRFDVESLMQNHILLLHELHSLHDLWHEDEASHLWNYNLHYLEFLIPLAVKYHAAGNEKYKQKYLELLMSWLKAADSNADANAAYTISMRIPNVLIGMELLGSIEESLEKKIYQSLYDQYRYLRQHLERALLANHYFENIKAVVIASVLFGELDSYHKYFDLFLKQIEEQILPDGLHYERSLMYHKIILEDILRVYMVLQSSGHKMDGEKLLPTIKSMAEALGSLEKGLGHTPLFNDAGDNISKPAAALLAVCRKLCGEIDTGKTVFPDAGYYRFDSGNAAVLFDCGDIGPGYMAGHAHNDCLSFQFSKDGKSIFANSGTGQYQGSRRQFFRSTRANNTVMIDDREQSELWGEHRVARRLDCIRADLSKQGICGQFRSYQKDGYRRQMQWQEDSLLITDTVKCRDADRHIARQFFHLTPGYRFERDGKNINVIDGGSGEIVVVIVVSEKADLLIHTEGEITVCAREFGKYEKKQVLEVRTVFRQAEQLCTQIKITDHKAGWQQHGKDDRRD